MAQKTKKQTTKKTTKHTSNNGNRRNDDKPKAVYFLSLTVENVRCFGEKQMLDLSDGSGKPRQWTIILGDNGTGKTTLLQCLVALSPIETSDPMERGKKTKVDPSYISSPYSDEMQIYFKWKPLRVVKEVDKSTFLAYASFSSGTKLTEPNKKTEVGALHVRWIPPTGQLFGGESYEKLGNFVSFGYGASRYMNTNGAVFTTDEWNSPSSSLFLDKAELIDAKEWLFQSDYISMKRRKPLQKQTEAMLERVKQILIKVLPNVSDIKLVWFDNLYRSPTVLFYQLYYDCWIPLEELSLGYRTLIAWMVDFAARMFVRYPNSENPLEEPAVVLVDEIDLHLHPKWQRDLIDYLTNLFPNTQFIVTTHSPLIVQAAAARDANIVVCRREGDHVVIDNSPEAVRGWRADQILASELFDNLPPRDKKVERLLQKRNRILSKSKLTKHDREELEKLEEKLGPVNSGETPEEIEAMDIIRRAAAELK